MKIIVSHDVDHITAREHSKDFIIPKFALRALIEYGLGFISGREVKDRFLSLITNQWNHIEDLMVFDRLNGIPSTFFIGMHTGRYLSYGKDVAQDWIIKIRKQGFDAGVHGIDYDDLKIMTEEHREFKQMSGLNAFGIRMHYLKMTSNTIALLDNIGYAFDSTEMAMRNPYKVGHMWEFPVHIMDSNILRSDRPWQSRNLEQAQQETERCISQALDMGISYFTLLFHDHYFCDEFQTWKHWYVWFVDYCKENAMDFVSYRDACSALDMQANK